VAVHHFHASESVVVDAGSDLQPVGFELPLVIGAKQPALWIRTTLALLPLPSTIAGAPLAVFKLFAHLLVWASPKFPVVARLATPLCHFCPLLAARVPEKA